MLHETGNSNLGNGLLKYKTTCLGGDEWGGGEERPESGISKWVL